MMEIRNPFADFGTPVTGSRFVGRDDELRQIESRLFAPASYGAMAIVGLPKIGKTSLLTEAVQRAEPRFRDQKTVVVRMDMGTCCSVDDFFRTLVTDLLHGVRRGGWSNDRIETQAAAAVAAAVRSFSPVRDTFRTVRRADIRAICILDEFDAARYLFKGAQQSFHWLRELSSNPEFKAGIVLISKRPLREVARIAGYDSDYWSNVLMTVTLRPFSPADTAAFFARLKDTGIMADAETLNEVALVCGCHPYLLDAFAFHAFQQVSQGRTLDVSWFHLSMRAVVREYLVLLHLDVVTIYGRRPLPTPASF